MLPIGVSHWDPRAEGEGKAGKRASHGEEEEGYEM
jgi:hypothetical protein